MCKVSSNVKFWKSSFSFVKNSVINKMDQIQLASFHSHELLLLVCWSYWALTWSWTLNADSYIYPDERLCNRFFCAENSQKKHQRVVNKDFFFLSRERAKEFSNFWESIFSLIYGNTHANKMERPGWLLEVVSGLNGGNLVLAYWKNFLQSAFFLILDFSQ